MYYLSLPLFAPSALNIGLQILCPCTGSVLARRFILFCLMRPFTLGIGLQILDPVSLCWLCAGSSFLIILLVALSALGIGLQILDPVSLRWLSYCAGSSFRILLPYSPHSPYASASKSWTMCLCASSVLARRFFLFVFSPYVVFSPHPSVAFELSQISRE